MSIETLEMAALKRLPLCLAEVALLWGICPVSLWAIYNRKGLQVANDWLYAEIEKNEHRPLLAHNH
jgi:hypothetical protein